MKRAFLLTVLVFSACSSLMAVEWTTWALDAGFAYQVNSQIGTDPEGKQPGKLMFNPGASFFAEFSGDDGGMFFQPAFWFSWGIENVYDGIARPCDEAKLDHMKVLGLMLDFPLGYAFTTRNLRIGLQGGPAIYARLPLYTAQGGSGVPADFWMAYYGAAQFLYLSVASWVSFPISEQSEFLAGLRFYQPVSNLWTDAPFAHGIQVGLMASVSFRLDGKADENGTFE